MAKHDAPALSSSRGLAPYSRRWRNPPKKPQKKKDPARPTRAKAARPQSAATPERSPICSTRHRQGHRRHGFWHRPAAAAGQFLGPPADFSAAHKARKSTQRVSRRRRSADLSRRRSRLDPQLAEELGLSDDLKHSPAARRPTAQVPRSGPSAVAARRLRRRRQQSLERLLREGRREFADRQEAGRSGRRTARRGRRNPKAASRS